MEERDGAITRIIFSIILGILPSFLLFSIFNQSSLSFIRYKDFLLDLNSSWASWISIIFIAIIVYFLLSIIKSKKKKVFFLAIIIILSLGSVIFFLYANFLLGNDLLVKLSADKENIFFSNSSEQSITLTISALMNPFCIAQCQYSFFDISSGKAIETGEFTMASLLPKTQQYSFNSEGHLQGQKLNRFEVSCKSQKTKLCYTSEQKSKRSILVTLNYDLSQEQKIANELSKKEIISLREKIYNMSQELKNANYSLKELNNFIITENLLSEFANLSYTLLELNISFEELKQEWISQNYSDFEKTFPELKEKTNNIIFKKDKFVLSVNLNILQHNSLANLLNESRIKIKELNLTNLSESSCIELNNLITELNETIKKFEEKSNLSYKEKEVNNFSSKIQNIYELPKQENDSICLLTKIINEESLANINPILANYTLPEFFLEDPFPICCFYGKCEKCCDESCSNTDYPIIFLHGHSFNNATSADYSLDAFSEIKTKLEEQGYVDAGSVIISKSNEQKGLWGKVNAPIEVTASYFFDVTKSETGEETIVSSKTVGIDTYSLRLNDLIKIVKERTGKEKVIIIAHSMGGLVARRYVQIFGEEDLDKLALITTPNQGIESTIRDSCSLIGSKTECSDMAKNSLLINKLMNSQNMSIPVYNIIGTGCEMGTETGDGIVKESNQYLIYAKNYYIDGVCNEVGLKFLHNRILYPEEYPKTIKIIKEFLKE
ncbi:MAG: alpha/beta fold hydrolase [archaeon]